MQARIVLMALLIVCPSYVRAEQHQSSAAQVVQRYLALGYPDSQEDSSSTAEHRSAMLELLNELTALPAEEVVRAIGSALGQTELPHQRHELVEMLGHVKTRESAALLCDLLKDQDDRVRWWAISGLRGMARCTDRPGGKRVPLGPESAPQVDGLVPVLVSAASDDAEGNRVCALFALADTRDQLAVAELRRRLKDPSDRVRFYAACFLTEFQDASGLPEMRRELNRLSGTSRLSPEDYGQAEMLLASLERLTGKSFGPIPLNPTLASVSGGERERYDELLAAWAAWWAWEPGTESE